MANDQFLFLNHNKRFNKDIKYCRQRPAPDNTRVTTNAKVSFNCQHQFTILREKIMNQTKWYNYF